MKRGGRGHTHAVLWLLVVVMAFPPSVFSQDARKASSAAFSKEQLEQILAPIALYPDDVITQILMASTYPLEIVQAERWVSKNKDVKGDALASALEKQDWDPSVKSLVNFPQVLSMMSEKLDWTQKLGDAFLAQEKEVMNTVQVLRKRAKDAGNLETTKEQKVIVEQETIIIEPADPEVIYVPTYNPAVIYGTWPYPAYPPYYWYPPGYYWPVATPYFGFGVGLALGAAWGYAWGHANWHGGDVNIDIDRNRNVNRNIDRGKYAQQRQQRGQGTQGKWQHDASHRKGVAYRDSGTARQFGQSSSRPTASTREARGFGEGRGTGGQARDFSRGGGSYERGGRQNAFSGAGNGGFERSASQRGQSSFSGGGSRGSGGFSGGGGSRGGGGFSGGGGGRGGGGGGRR